MSKKKETKPRVERTSKRTVTVNGPHFQVRVSQDWYQKEPQCNVYMVREGWISNGIIFDVALLDDLIDDLQETRNAIKGEFDAE